MAAATGRGCGRRSTHRRALAGSALPEPLPGFPPLWQGAPSVVVRRPVRGLESQRVHAYLGAVEQLVHAPDEVPATVALLVGVEVGDGLVNPPVAVLDLALAVHDT